MMIDEIINDDNLTNQLQNALKSIDKYSVEIDGIFDTLYAVATTKYTNVTRDNDSIVITFENSEERESWREFCDEYLVYPIKETLKLDNTVANLIYKVYHTSEYVDIIRKRK